MEECLYLEHYQILQECKKARKEYDNILEEKAKAYYGTQPQSTKPKAIVTMPNGNSTKLMDYCAELEIINEKVESARNILGIREYRLKLKEQELMNSVLLLDKIYVMRYIKHMKVKHISLKISYTREYTYELIKKVDQSLLK